MEQDDRILRAAELTLKLGLTHKQSVYDQVHEGVLPPPVKIGLRAAGWPLSEVNKIFAARVAGASTEGVQRLVLRIIEARKAQMPVDAAPLVVKRPRGRPRKVQPVAVAA